MIIRRYRGKTLESLRETVVKEMGNNAVIIHSQKLNENGIIGKFKGKAYEIIAAIEEPVTEGELSSGKDVNIDELMSSQKSHYLGIRRSMKLMDDKLASLDSRFEQMATTKESSDRDFPPMLKNVHKDWHRKILSRIKDPDNASTEEFQSALGEFIPTAGGIFFRQTTGNRPDIYALAGPTGVGKTTTLAKLAAQAVLKSKLNVGLITIDTFRVGAVDQLREYSTLLGVELAVVFTAKEMDKQIEKFQDKDIILIDSQGRGPFDEEGINTIKETLKTIKDVNILLTVPTGIRKEDAVKIFNSFRCLSPSCMILTKSDETTCCDGLTTLFDLADIPVIYVTDGQRVPEDIHSASSGLITAMIIKEETKI
jgi:flagellar biosynthesis protein FlhF